MRRHSPRSAYARLPRTNASIVELWVPVRYEREDIDFGEHERLPRLRNVIYVMSEQRGDGAEAYVETAAELLALPLSAERASAVAAVMRRIASFAVHVAELELGKDVEIAGVFRP